MIGFNKVILMGNLAADPELKQTTSGISTVSVSLAVNRPHQKDTPAVCDFIRIIAWRSTAEFLARNFKKGKPVLLWGSIQNRTWTDQKGGKHTITEVVAENVMFAGGNGQGQEPTAPDLEEISPDENLPF